VRRGLTGPAFDRYSVRATVSAFERTKCNQTHLAGIHFYTFKSTLPFASHVLFYFFFYYSISLVHARKHSNTPWTMFILVIIIMLEIVLLRDNFLINYSYEHMNRPFSRPRNEYYCDSYNPAWSNQSNFSWQAQDHRRYAPQGHELHHQSYSQFNDQSYFSQYQATPQQQYQAAPPPRYDSNFEDWMLQMMGEIRDKLNVTVDKMTQTIKSCSESIVKIETYEEEPSPIYWLPQQYQAEPPPQKNFNVEESIAKIEAHLEKSINHPNREDEELQGQLVANPNEHYMVDESTYPEQAITTLKSEEVVKNHMEERKEEKNEEQIEASQDLLREKCKEVSAEASSPSILIPEAPYEL
jgi:hypothetical protein